MSAVITSIHIEIICCDIPSVIRIPAKSIPSPELPLTDNIVPIETTVKIIAIILADLKISDSFASMTATL